MKHIPLTHAEIVDRESAVNLILNALVGEAKDCRIEVNKERYDAAVKRSYEKFGEGKQLVLTTGFDGNTFVAFFESEEEILVHDAHYKKVESAE